MNVIEISSSAIRLVRERDGRLLGMDSWPIPPGADPLVALSAAPLPNPLGRVAVLMHHDDMLIRSLLQPAADHERLNRLVRFELASMAGETGEATAISWHAVNVSLGDGAELRVLALLAKGEKYGFELARELGARGQIIASEGTLYPLLARLRRNGLVETSWQESTSGPPRRYYHLTRNGEQALASFTKQWRVFRDAVEEILNEGSQE